MNEVVEFCDQNVLTKKKETVQRPKIKTQTDSWNFVYVPKGTETASKAPCTTKLILLFRMA